MASDAEATLAACRRERESMLASLSMLPALVRAVLGGIGTAAAAGSATIVSPAAAEERRGGGSAAVDLPHPVVRCLCLSRRRPPAYSEELSRWPRNVLPLRNFVRRRTGGGGEKASDVHAAGCPERRSSLKDKLEKNGEHGQKKGSETSSSSSAALTNDSSPSSPRKKVQWIERAHAIRGVLQVRPVLS